ncbi:MAG TPA: TonB-dependent receptor [Allosphingosinicella sp.]|nr:TonB-dependent receptor [Allosphingosinicella sp.]
MTNLTPEPLGSHRAVGSKFLLAAASSVAALAIASPAAAQDNAAPAAAQGSAPAPVAQDQTSDNNEIVVTGIRGSLQRDLDIKRSAPGVVDAISAEDIGKFPDSNVASALQRLPGVSIQRDGPRGDATGVTVRGFGGGFNDTLYDGRHISTATGRRDVDFTTVGSDFVGQINVYKTPDVTLSTSAIGATIDVLLPKPFDHPGFHMTVIGSGSLQSRNKDVEPSAGLLLTDTFAGDTFGILADVVYTRHDTTTNQVDIPGWVGNHFYQCQLTPTCTAADLTAANKTVLGWFPQQSVANQVTTHDERIDGRVAIQWRPTDGVLLTIDDNFTRQMLRSTTYGYGAWFNGDDLRNVKLDSNGTVVDFNQFGTPMDFNANVTRQIIQTNQVGANLKWDATEHLRFDVDASYAKSVLNPNNDGYADSMDIGYGGDNSVGQGPPIPGDFYSTPCASTAPFNCTNYTTVLGANTGLKINGPSSQNLPNTHDVGPAGNVSQFLNTAVVGSHVIVRFKNYNTDTVKQARAMGTWADGNFKLTFGGQYKEDSFYQQNWNTFTNGVFGLYSGYGPPSGRFGNSIAPLPAGVYMGTISTAGFIPGYDSSVLAPGFFVYNPYAVYAALEATGHGSTAPAFDPSSVLGVKERTYALFMKASFDADIAGMPLHLNFGLRDEGTHLTTRAIGVVPTSLTINPGDPTLANPVNSPPQNVQLESNYNYLLPSADLKLEVTHDLIFRLDASRTLTRPLLADLKPTVNLGSLRRGSFAGTGGNPNLTPYLSDNFDAAVEWYYGRNSYFAVDAFLKDLTNFIVGGVHTAPINNVIDPFTGQVAQFNITGKVNGPNATVRGLEIALQHVFGNTGFGFQANATLVSTNRNFNTADISGAAFAITGLANSANLVAFYDKHGFQVRVAVNWRDSYLLGLGQAQGGTFGAEPVFVDAQTQIDASASYDFNKHITVFVEGTNLNNSTLSTHGRFSNQLLDVFSYGRRFTAGARFHF